MNSLITIRAAIKRLFQTALEMARHEGKTPDYIRATNEQIADLRCDTEAVKYMSARYLRIGCDSLCGLPLLPVGSFHDEELSRRGYSSVYLSIEVTQ